MGALHAVVGHHVFLGAVRRGGDVGDGQHVTDHGLRGLLVDVGEDAGRLFGPDRRVAAVVAVDVHAPDLELRVLGGLFSGTAPPLADVVGVDQELARRELGARVGGVLAHQGVGVHDPGGEELAGPLQRFEILLRLDAVDHLAVDEVPAERLLTAGEDTEHLPGGPLHVQAGPALGLGVGDLLGQRQELVRRPRDFVPLLVEDVLAVEGHDAGDVRLWHRQAAQLAADDAALPGVGRDGREVRVLLDRVPGEVGAEVGELADDGAGYLAAHVPAGDDHHVRYVAGGEDRAELLVVGVAVLVLPDDVDADQVVHPLVVGVVLLGRGAPERRHDGDLAALAELLGHRGLEGGEVQLAGEADRGAVLGGDVGCDDVAGDVGRQDLLRVLARRGALARAAVRTAAGGEQRHPTRHRCGGDRRGGEEASPAGPGGGGSGVRRHCVNPSWRTRTPGGGRRLRCLEWNWLS
ncbi:hypothetical protein SAURM35S_07606 [Streptomyces aurantiogriseus]